MNPHKNLRHLLDWQYIDGKLWRRHLERAVVFYRAGHTWWPNPPERSLALMFFNPSLRTRTSMELAGAQLGAHVTTLSPGQGTWHFSFEDGQVMDGVEAEHIREAAGVLSRYYDAIGVRVFASLSDYVKDRDETLINTFAEASTVPVINLESAFYHPCQALADAATITTHFDGDLKNRRFVLAWAFHPKALPMAVPNSALLMAARSGMNVTVARPDAYALDPSIMDLARAYAALHGTTVNENNDPVAALSGADVVYAKAWSGRLVYSNPQQEAETRMGLKHWRITRSLMDLTNNAAFMHCLPVRRNVVVDDDVIDGPNAIHLLQAEYRLFAQKAILEWVWDL